MKSLPIPTLFEALLEVEKELDDEELSDRRRKKALRFYEELMDELNSRAESFVAEPRYVDDVDRGRVV